MMKFFCIFCKIYQWRWRSKFTFRSTKSLWFTFAFFTQAKNKFTTGWTFQPNRISTNDSKFSTSLFNCFSSVRFYNLLGLFLPNYYFFFPKTLFFRTLGKSFEQIVFLHTFSPFFFVQIFCKYPFTLSKLCFTNLRNSK